MPLWGFSNGGKKRRKENKEKKKEEKNTKKSGHYVCLHLNRLHNERSDQYVRLQLNRLHSDRSDQYHAGGVVSEEYSKVSSDPVVLLNTWLHCVPVPLHVVSLHVAPQLHKIKYTENMISFEINVEHSSKRTSSLQDPCT